MKRYLVLFAAIFLFSGYAFAEEIKLVNVPQKDEPDTVKNEYSRTNRVMMNYGKMMMMKDGYIMLVTDDIIMSNGTRVMKCGDYLLKDGSKMIMMKEGDSMDMDGMLCRH